MVYGYWDKSDDMDSNSCKFPIERHVTYRPKEDDSKVSQIIIVRYAKDSARNPRFKFYFRLKDKGIYNNLCEIGYLKKFNTHPSVGFFNSIKQFHALNGVQVETDPLCLQPWSEQRGILNSAPYALCFEIESDEVVKPFIQHCAQHIEGLNTLPEHFLFENFSEEREAMTLAICACYKSHRLFDPNLIHLISNMAGNFLARNIDEPLEERVNSDCCVMI